MSIVEMFGYNFIEKEQKWQNFWQEKGIYKFDKNSSKPTYSIDTPPPTVSGKIHIGHIFSYSQTEMQMLLHSVMCLPATL